MSIFRLNQINPVRPLGLAVGIALLLTLYVPMSLWSKINRSALLTAELILSHSEDTPLTPAISSSPGKDDLTLNPASPAQARLIYHSAIQLLSTGDQAGAESAFSKLLDCNVTPLCEQSKLALGELQAKRGMLQQADLIWHSLHASEYFSARGEQALVAGQPKLSLLYFSNAARPILSGNEVRMSSDLASDLRAGLYQLGQYFQGQQRYPDAIQSYQLCSQVFPDLVPCRLNAAQVYLLQGLSDQAEAELTNGIQSVKVMINPQGAALLYQALSRLQNEEEGPEKAINTLLYAQSAGISNAELSVQLGIYLRDAGRFEKAIQQFKLAGQNSDSSTAEKAQRQLAYTLIQTGDIAQAASIFRSLVSGNHTRGDDLLTLARLSIQLDNLDEACLYYQQSLALLSTTDADQVIDMELQAKCTNNP